MENKIIKLLDNYLDALVALGFFTFFLLILFVINCGIIEGYKMQKYEKQVKIECANEATTKEDYDWCRELKMHKRGY